MWWANDDKIQRVGLDGTSPETFDDAGTFRLQVDDTHVYWSATNGRTILRKPKSADFTVTAEAIASDLGGAFYFVLDGDFIYWTENEGGLVRRARKDGSEMIDLASARLVPSHILVDDHSVFWIEPVGDEFQTTRRLLRLPK